MAALIGAAPRPDSLRVPLIVKSPSGCYFQDENGDPWTPVGQNDGIDWPELNGLYRRRDPQPAERYFRMLADHGVTCLRLMLEYSESRWRRFERPAGPWNPRMVAFWDDLFALCRTYGLRVLLTPFDTFWMWKRWHAHPYNSANGGPCASPRRWLLCRETRKRIKARLEFAALRWGGDGTIFAWDLWNEVHPAHAGEDLNAIVEFVEDLSGHVRTVEQRAFGYSRLQTVSVFHEVLITHPEIADLIFRHPALDFATAHLYQHGTIDDPKNTVDAAVGMGGLVANALDKIRDGRPFFDSEHGPIHSFKDHHRTLPAAFDDEYFRHMQWAHLASGGAGGGMRWPNRRPHSLTPGMREAQRAMAAFLPCIDWNSFRRMNRRGSVSVDGPRGCAVFACSDDRQAVVYLLRGDTKVRRSVCDRTARPAKATVRVAGLKPGAWRVTAWDTVSGRPVKHGDLAHFTDEPLVLQTPEFAVDLALAITRRPSAP